LSKPVSRWEFGPDGGNVHHPFYAALARMPKSDFARRTSWLRARSFTDDFLALAPERGQV
jgi:hypothetical protein